MSKLKEGEDLYVFLTNMEALVLKLEELGKIISEKYLIVGVLNSLPDRYEIEVAQLE